MQVMPLVGAEVQRIDAAFRTASLELATAARLAAELGPPRVGTPVADGALESGLGDLREVLVALAATAEECHLAARRHLTVDETPGPRTDSGGHDAS